MKKIVKRSEHGKITVKVITKNRMRIRNKNIVKINKDSLDRDITIKNTYHSFNQVFPMAILDFLILDFQTILIL